jgi:hypothetical protein
MTYHLRSEIERARAKHPPFDLVLPDVKLPAGTPIEEGESPNEFDSATISVPSAVLLPDDVVELATTNSVAAAKALIGEHAYAHLIAAGGSSSILFQTIQRAAGADVGESGPSDAS